MAKIWKMILSRDEKGKQNVTNITLICVRSLCSRLTFFFNIGLCSFIFEFRELKLVQTFMKISHQTTAFYLV